MNKKTRVLEDISRLIDKQLILELNRYEINTLVGIKNTLRGFNRCCYSHEQSVEKIKLRLSTETFPISILDRIRFEGIVIPRMGGLICAWDFDCSAVPFDIALDLFNADLEYLLSSEVLSRLGPAGVDARQQVLANIGASTLHYRFGRGSKVSRWQYRNLIAATQCGWIDHLVELGLLAPKEPVYELGQPSWTSKTEESRNDDCCDEADLASDAYERFSVKDSSSARL